MTMALIVRVVVDGWTWRSDQHDNVDDAKGMLLEALTSRAWPTDQAKFIVTPGGFVRMPFQFGYIQGGWGSEHHFDRLKVPGTDAVKRLLTEEVLRHLVDRAKFLTIGIDLNNTDDKFSDETHAELVALVDVELGEVIHLERTCEATRSADVVDVTVTGFKCHVETKWKRWARR